MKKIAEYFLLLNLILLGCNSSSQKANDDTNGNNKYEPTWESLAKHNEAPDWFKDAKLGIYFHWGVYSVPAFGSEWYPRNMHIKGSPVYDHHESKYGKPAEYGYHDFVPLFQAEKFNANEWAELFKKAGARFAGPVAEHHDGFAMWDSEVTPWNAADKGPQRDITGELEEAIKQNGMKFITTFHHARNLQRYKGKEKEEIEMEVDNPGWRFGNSHYPLFPEMPPTWDDEELNYLYGNIPEEKWLKEIWFGKLKEVVDQYQPDIIWFDSWLDLIPEEYRQEFCAYYLNQANTWGKEVVIVRKQDDLPLDVSVDDLEKSRKNEIDEKVWMTDETVSTGSWSYTTDLEIKPAADVLHVLIDIVSKNGVLLLNISPKADGTIPQEQKEVLLAIGDWLNNYGEAIYETRPWYTFGEGPTKEPEGHFKNHEEFLKIKYSEKDVRYTTKDNTVYATILGWPGSENEILLKSFSEEEWKDRKEIKNVEMLGSGEAINFKLNENGLALLTPSDVPNNKAIVFKISLK